MKKSELQKIYNAQKDWFYKEKSLSPSFKIKVLTRLKKAIVKNIAEIHLALSRDLGLKNEEYCFYETSQVLIYINRCISSLKSKIKSKNHNPKGTSLIISGRYSPFLNSMVPLVDAIMRGDVCFLKLSHSSKETSIVIKDMLDNAFPEKYIFTLTENHQKLKGLLSLDFDYVYFSGTKETAITLAESCAKKLIPYQLNIYSPKVTFVSRKNNLKKTASDFILDKFIDCGQYQNSPDFLVVENDIFDDFINLLVYYIETYIGNDPLIDDDYGRICDEDNYTRLLTMIEGKETLYGGAKSEATLQIGPVIFTVNEDDEILKHKVFGPLIPILKVDGINIETYRKYGQS